MSLSPTHRETFEAPALPEGPGLAVFVSPHGFGHAARACAVLEALGKHLPGLHLQIWTLVPRWFFEESLSIPFEYLSLQTDVGLLQHNAFQVDLPGTVQRLRDWWPQPPSTLESIAARVLESGCLAILCDVSPLGLAIAEKAGLPGILLENFTWDWIYAGYSEKAPELEPFSRNFHSLTEQAALHIQTQPVCGPRGTTLQVPPVARAPREQPQEIRRRLEVPDRAALVLITTGGIAFEPRFLGTLESLESVVFAVPGPWKEASFQGNLRLLPHSSGLFHPDLVAACGAVVGKLGYSTLAETHCQGVPFLFVERPDFRESAVLAQWLLTRGFSDSVSVENFEQGHWQSQLLALLEQGPLPATGSTGAEAAAKAIQDFLGKGL